jgi:iron complex transport system substrate-binding protein
MFRRIVSLCPSTTELVCDLGAADRLVGVTRFCVHPKPVVDAKVKVGGTKDPDIARIAELAPDLVLLNEEENRKEDLDALSKLGIRCHVSFPKTPVETAQAIRELGAVLESPEGERLASRLEQAIHAAAARALGRAPCRFAYLIWRRPWMSVTPDTFISALLELSGGVNVIPAGPTRYPELDLATLRQEPPDVVLLPSEPFPFSERHVDEVAQGVGIQRDRLRLVDGELLSWHGSRTLLGIPYAESVLFGTNLQAGRPSPSQG